MVYKPYSKTAHLAEVEAGLLLVGDTTNLEQGGVGLLVALAAGETLDAALDVESGGRQNGDGQLPWTTSPSRGQERGGQASETAWVVDVALRRCWKLCWVFEDLL